MTKSIADWNQAFLAQMEAIRLSAENRYKSVVGEEQRQEIGIDRLDWSGDPTDQEGLAAAFNRDSLDETFGKMLQSPGVEGVSGDLQVLIAQGDLMAAYERSVRSRMMSKPRATLHAAARKRGHGSVAGPLQRGFVEAIASIMQKSKETS